MVLSACTANGDLVFPGMHPLLPDINTGWSTVNYDGSSGFLTVYGLPAHYGDVNGPDISGNVSFAISGAVDTLASTTPTSITDGTLAIYGQIPGVPDGLLLSGAVDRMGMVQLTTTGDYYADFSFQVTGGSLASAYGGIGAQGGTIIKLLFSGDDGDVAFSNFHTSFQYNGAANTNDTFSTVPEPSSLTLMVASVIGGLATSVWRRVWKRRD
jgi:hypothetical protein